MFSSILFFTAFCLVFSVCVKTFSVNLVSKIYSQLTYSHIFYAFLLLILVLSLFSLLSYTFPFLKYGWMHLFMSQGGSLIGTTAAVERGLSGNPVHFIQTILFFLLLLYAMPHIVTVEEEIFRKGILDIPTILLNSTKFGLAHCLVGLPLSVGIALIPLGIFFGLCYRRSYYKAINNHSPTESESIALNSSILLHCSYNLFIICFAISLTFFLLFHLY